MFATVWALENALFRAAFLWVMALLLALGLAAPGVAQDTPLRFAKIAAVQTQQDGLSRVFFGRVVARQTVDLAFQVGGQILDLPAEEGANLEAGALIAQLDLEPFELALEDATAKREQAARTLERLRRLEGSAVSAVTVEDAQTESAVANIRVKDAERSLRLATLTAPFDALVAARNVSNFTTIAAGNPVVRLHDMSDLRVEIDVPEILFQRAGADPNVSLAAEFPASPERYPLEFREFNAETTAVGQTFRITLGMPPQPGLAVLPGSSVTVHATFEDAAQGVRIPASAVMIGNDGATAVMVFQPGEDDTGTLSRRAVEVVPTPMGALVVASGLEAGEEIVMSGASLLDEGETVRRFTGFSN